MATITRGTTQTDLVDPNWPATAVASVVSAAPGPLVTYPNSKLDGWTPINQEGQLHRIWAGLQQPAAGEQYIVTYSVAPNTLIHGTDFVKAAFVVALRAAFTAQTLYPAYTYSVKDTDTKLGIYESFPKRPFKNPGIVVSIGAADMNRTTLSGTDLLKEERDSEGVPVAYFAWGSVPMQVNVGIVAITDSDRRKLTDITAHFIRHLFAYQFSKFGIGYKSVHIDGEKDSEWQGQLLYMNNISIPVYTEWQVKYPIALVDVISAIELKDIEALL